MEDLPDEFWLSIRHISSFRNKSDYDAYLELKINEWIKSQND